MLTTAAMRMVAGLLSTAGQWEVRRPWRLWIGAPLACRFAVLAVRTVVHGLFAYTPWPVSAPHLLIASVLLALGTLPLQRAVSLGNAWLLVWCTLLLAFLQYLGASVHQAGCIPVALGTAAALADVLLGVWVVTQCMVPAGILVLHPPVAAGQRRRDAFHARQACWGLCASLGPMVLLPQILLLLCCH